MTTDLDLKTQNSFQVSFAADCEDGIKNLIIFTRDTIKEEEMSKESTFRESLKNNFSRNKTMETRME